MSYTPNCKCIIEKDKAEEILKAYRKIRWGIEASRYMTSLEAKKLGINENSIALLKEVFFQKTDLDKLATEQVDLVAMFYIKKIVDITLESLKRYPDDGVLLNQLIDILYIEDREGIKLKFEEAYEEYKKWAYAEYNKTISMATFKNYRAKAIELMAPVMSSHLNRLIERAEANKIRKVTKLNNMNRTHKEQEGYETVSGFTASA